MSIFIFCHSKAQTSIYHPFPDSNAVWNVSFYCGLGLGFEKYSYTFDGDTSINGITYHKVVIPSIVRQGGCPNHSVGYFACIRHDTASRIVYYIPRGDSVEKILLNFDLQVGDPFVPAFLNGCFYGRDTVASIDSILIGNTFRKRWVLVYGLAIIEGIGYPTGLFEACLSGVPDVGSSMLLCFKENGQVLYSVATDSCNIILATSAIAKELSLTSIFPNPFHSNAILRVDSEYLGSRMTVYNVIGDKIGEYILDSSEYVIKRENLINGVYFYKIENSKNQSVAGKFIVN